MAMRTAPDLARVVPEASRAVGRRLVLGRGWANLAPDGIGPDGIVVGDVNHQALFARLAAVAGTPQVIVPQLVDQPHWARRVAELGIGAAHEGPVPTSESLASSLEVALRPETRSRAIDVSSRVQRDGATVAARRLLDGWPATARRATEDGIGRRRTIPEARSSVWSR